MLLESQPKLFKIMDSLLVAYFGLGLTLWVPGDFLMLVYRGGVLFHTPFQNDFLLQKIIFFFHGQILAKF